MPFDFFTSTANQQHGEMHISNSWQGLRHFRCEEDIDECDSDPCRNNATLGNSIGRYFFICTEDFRRRRLGESALRYLRQRAVPQQCQFRRLFDALTLLTNNYICQFPFGFDRINCKNPILDPCRNDGFCIDVSLEPVSFSLFRISFHVNSIFKMNWGICQG